MTMQARRTKVSALAVLLGVVLASAGHAERFDYLVGANSPNGETHLVKSFRVPARSIISGVEFVTNEISTSFPKVMIVEGSSRRLSAAPVLAEISNVRSAGRHRVSVRCDRVAIREETDIFVVIQLPAANGVRGRGDGVGIAARGLSGPANSYFVSGMNGAFGEMEMEFAITLVFDERGKADAEIPGDGQPQETVIPVRTFLSADHGLSENAVVRFGLEKDCEVAISIFDARGRLVHTVERGQLAAGTYARTWNARNNAGARVARGVYLIRLVAQEKVLSQKLVVAQ